MLRKRSLLLLSVFVLASAIACAPTHPTYETVENNLNNPTGTVDQNSTTNAWSGYQASEETESFLSQNAKVEFLKKRGIAPKSLFDYLAKAGIPRRILPIFKDILPNKNDYSLNPTAQKIDGLSIRQSISIGCYSGSVNGENARFTIDIGCLKKGSGSLTVSREGWNNKSGSIEIIFNHVCDLQGDCVHGAIGIKANVSGIGMMKKGNFLYAHELQASRKNGKEASSKGGFRLSYDGASKSAKMEFVIFVKGPNGEEGSLVIIFAHKGQNSSFQIKGKNGTFSCTSNNNGEAGQCSGSVNGKNEKFSWNSSF